MARAVPLAYANASLPPSVRTHLVCTERAELPNDSYMLKLQMQVCEPEVPRTHTESQSSWRPLAPAPAPIMQPWQQRHIPRDAWTEASHPQAPTHPSYYRHYPNVQPQAVSHYRHTRSPSPSPSTHSPSPVPSTRSSSSSSSACSPSPSPPKPPPLALPVPHKDSIRRTVPQQVWDPYASQRSAENARDVVIHHFPSGVTPLDRARVPFDLRGMVPGTGIPLSVLDAAHIDNTMRYVVDAYEPIQIGKQTWQHGSCFVAPDEIYSYVVLCMTWPAYPKVSRKRFNWRVQTHDASGPYTRAQILSAVSRLIIEFLEWAQNDPASASAGASPEDAMWAFGPSRLDFTRVSLVALYQMAGRYFMAEFSAEFPQARHRQHRDLSPYQSPPLYQSPSSHRPPSSQRPPSTRPQDERYYQDSPVMFYNDPPYRRK